MSDSFAVTAEFITGVFQGRTPGGEVDLVPAPARLLSAFVAAAAAGPRAVERDGLLVPCPQDLAALTWLENNPPDGVRLPETKVVRSSSSVYRDQGLMTGSSSILSTGKLARQIASFVAVNGDFSWTWDADPPVPVQESLNELSADVSHVGTAESPVRVRIDRAIPTHRRNADASLFSPGSNYQVATSGRVQALLDHHRKLTGSKMGKEQHASSESTQVPPVTTTGSATARYEQVKTEFSVTAPWQVVLVATLTPRHSDQLALLRANERVAAAVAIHRGLVRALGEDAPGVVTGHYAEGAKRPSNRVAIQFLQGSAARAAGYDPKVVTVLLMLPRDIDAVESAMVAGAFRAMTWISYRQGESRNWGIQHGKPRSAQQFWDAGDHVWRTDPLAVLEVTPPRSRGVLSMEEAVLVSVAFLDRDRFGAGGHGSQRAKAMSARVGSEGGVQVLRSSRVNEPNLGSFVHRFSADQLIVAHQSVLDLGTAFESTSLLAMGQSRHLGGGLLIPAEREDYL